MSLLPIIKVSWCYPAVR